MNYESLIFDIDGTLWDTRSLVAEGYNEQLIAEKLPHLCVTADDLTPLFGKTMTDIADILLAEIPAPERYALLDRCVESENRHLAASECNVSYPKVKQTLEELSKNHRLFIVSNSQKGYPELTMEKLGITHLILDHLCFGDTNAPKAVTIRTLMERNGITSAAYIGDTQGDLEACRGAGIPFIFAAYGLGQAEEWNAKIDSFEELLEL